MHPLKDEVTKRPGDQYAIQDAALVAATTSHRLVAALPAEVLATPGRGEGSESTTWMNMDIIAAIATGFHYVMGSRLEHAPHKRGQIRCPKNNAKQKLTNVLNACRLIMVCIAARTKIQLLRCPRTSPSSSNVDEARAEEEDVVEPAVEDAER